MKCTKDFSRGPIFYSPLLNHDYHKNSKSKNSQCNIVNTQKTKSVPLSNFIKSSDPTYQFLISDVKKPKSFYLRDEPLYDEKKSKNEDFKKYYSKISCVADLLLYPELSISKGDFITQNSTKLSHFSNIPSISDDKFGIIHCICHKKTENPMAMCSICNCWSHLQCLSISEDKIPDIFVCLYCQHNLVSGIKKRIVDLIAPIKSEILDHYKILESQENKCANDMMLQINGIYELKKIIKMMNNYTDQSRKIWIKICEVRNNLERIMRGFVWEKAQEDMETYDEASDMDDDQNSDKENNENDE